MRKFYVTKYSGSYHTGQVVSVVAKTRAYLLVFAQVIHSACAVERKSAHYTMHSCDCILTYTSLTACQNFRFGYGSQHSSRVIGHVLCEQNGQFSPIDRVVIVMELFIIRGHKRDMATK